MKDESSHEWDVVDFIKTKEEILFYLTTAFETDDLAYELRALEHAKRVLKELYDEAGTTVVIAPDT